GVGVRVGVHVAAADVAGDVRTRVVLARSVEVRAAARGQHGAESTGKNQASEGAHGRTLHSVFERRGRTPRGEWPRGAPPISESPDLGAPSVVAPRCY